MKKVSSISLALLLLFSNAGVSMNTHFCGGVAVETTLTLGSGNPGCGGEDMAQECEKPLSQETQFTSQPCCANEHQVIQPDTPFASQASSVSVHTIFLAAFAHALVLPAYLIEKEGLPLADHSPPIAVKDILLLFQRFLI